MKIYLMSFFSYPGIGWIVGFVFVVLFLIFVFAIATNNERKEKEDKKAMIEFLRLLLSSFHEVNWKLSPAPTSDENAEKIVERIKNHTGTEFDVLMKKMTVFPKKCSYRRQDPFDALLINETFDLLKECFEKYHKHRSAQNLDKIHKEFYTKLKDILAGIIRANS